MPFIFIIERFAYYLLSPTIVPKSPNARSSDKAWLAVTGKSDYLRYHPHKLIVKVHIIIKSVDQSRRLGIAVLLLR